MILLSVAILFRRVHYAHEYCREGMHVHNYVFHCDFTYPYVLRTNVILLARDPLDPFMNMRGSFLCARAKPCLFRIDSSRVVKIDAALVISEVYLDQPLIWNKSPPLKVKIQNITTLPSGGEVHGAIGIRRLQIF